jgi:hypothetical protein
MLDEVYWLTMKQRGFIGTKAKGNSVGLYTVLV